MTDASVVAVGTPQSFRQQLARAIEMGPDEVGWVQSATAAGEELLGQLLEVAGRRGEGRLEGLADLAVGVADQRLELA